MYPVPLLGLRSYLLTRYLKPLGAHMKMSPVISTLTLSELLVDPWGFRVTSVPIVW